MRQKSQFSLILPFFQSLTLLLCSFPFGDASNSRQTGVTQTHYFDLSYSINNDTIYYPGQKVEFSLNKDRASYTPGGYWYATYSFCMGEHGGTHVDAPIHFNRDGWTLDQIPPENMIDVPSVVVDMEDNVFSAPSASPDQFRLQVSHLLHHESIHGEIPFGSVVLLHTGWGRFWPNKVKYLGWDNSTGSDNSAPQPVLRFPGCSEEAAKWLANERGIVGFGIDTPSVDIGDNKGNLSVHILFAKRQIYNLENVANLHLILQAMRKVEFCNLRLFVLPIKITGATGGPTRILAYCKN